MTAALRVLLTADSVGGVWQYALDLARGLKPLGIEAVVAHMGPPPSDAQCAEAADVSVVETGLALDWLVDGPEPVAAAAQALSALARRERVDLVHLNTPALAAAFDVAVPLIVVDHGSVSTWWEAARAGTPLDRQFAWHRRMTGEGLRAADVVVAPSAGYAEAVARTYGYDRPIRVVHNGRTAVSASTTEPIAAVFTAGRLWDAAKRTPLLDTVAARLSVPFRAAGARIGPHGEAVATEHLIALGSLSHEAMAAELARRPVFVSAAIFEPFGLAVLEAAQAGCALVLADTPVFRELWDGAATFVAGDSPPAYAGVIEALIADATARTHDGDAARTRAARYTPAAMAEGMRAIYNAALAARAPREQAA